MIKNFTFLSIIVISLCYSCKSVYKNTVINTLSNSNWILIHLDENSILANNNISLTLDTVSYRFRGFGGCNTYSGTFTTKDMGHISFSKIISTKKHCVPPTTEPAYFSALSKANSCKLQNNELILFVNEVEIARFKKE